MYYEIQKK
jgi:hypothetical protein